MDMDYEARIKELGFNSIAEFQLFYGLPATNVLDDATKQMVNVPRFCAVADTLPLGEGLPRWGKQELKFSMIGSLKGIPNESMVRAAETAWSRIMKVCDIRASHIKTPGEAADIAIAVGAIDGRGSVLAWAELPGAATTRPLQMRIGKDEDWVIADTTPVGKMDLIRVVAHELCHNLGLSHLGPGALMAPTYSATIKEPQAADIAELIRRYGPPKPIVPAPPDVPPGDENIWVNIRIPKSWVSQ